MRDNWLSNRIFKSYDDLVDLVVRHGTSSSTKLGASCPSDCANGPTGSDQWDLVLYQNSQTLTHAACRPTGTSIPKTYGSPMGYRGRAQARTVPRMSQCLRSLVLGVA